MRWFEPDTEYRTSTGRIIRTPKWKEYKTARMYMNRVKALREWLIREVSVEREALGMFPVTYDLKNLSAADGAEIELVLFDWNES